MRGMASAGELSICSEICSFVSTSGIRLWISCLPIPRRQESSYLSFLRPEGSPVWFPQHPRVAFCGLFVLFGFCHSISQYHLGFIRYVRKSGVRQWFSNRSIIQCPWRQRKGLEKIPACFFHLILLKRKNIAGFLQLFYSALEMQCHPKLHDKPLVVCGSVEDWHGMVLTANYFAKPRGVKTGMVVWQAKRGCPEIDRPAA